jgi:phosphatidylethanolamine-binding protein (PEBP) family uncharacterized protein
LRPLAKSTSAGALALALVLAALLPPGCGGGSSDSGDPATQGSVASAAVGQGGGSKGSSSSSSSSSSAQAEGGAGKARGDPAAPAGRSTGTAKGQKQGPRIAQPHGRPEQAPSPADVANATVADISLQSPSLPASPEGPARLSPSYTCDGKDSSPELRWSGVPAGSAELILYAMNVAPVEGKLFVDWAIAGLDPSLAGIEAGQLPKGAIVGTNSFAKRGYEICPPAGSGEIYIFALYALPRALAPPRGFDARELRQQILDVSGDVGLLSAYYARG